MYRLWQCQIWQCRSGNVIFAVWSIITSLGTPSFTCCAVIFYVQMPNNDLKFGILAQHILPLAKTTPAPISPSVQCTVHVKTSWQLHTSLGLEPSPPTCAPHDPSWLSFYSSAGSLKSIRGCRLPARTAPRATTVAEGWPTGWGRVHGLATRERESTISACKPLFWGVCKIVSLLIDKALLTLDHFWRLPCNNMAPPIALSSASLLKSPPKNKSLFQPHRHLAADTASFEGALVSRQDADWQGEVEWPTAAPPRSPTHAKQGQNRGCSAIRSSNMQLLTHTRFTLHFIQHLGQTSVNNLNLSIYVFLSQDNHPVHCH